MRNFSLPFPSIFASGNVCLALCQAPCGLEPTLWRMGYPNGFFKWQNSHSLAYKVCFPIYTWECRSSWASLIQLVSHEIFSLSLSFSLVFSVPSTTVIPQVWVGVPLLLEFLAIQIAGGRSKTRNPFLGDPTFSWPQHPTFRRKEVWKLFLRPSPHSAASWTCQVQRSH